MRFYCIPFWYMIFFPIYSTHIELFSSIIFFLFVMFPHSRKIGIYNQNIHYRYEFLNDTKSSRQKQSKSLGDLIDMDTTNSNRSELIAAGTATVQQQEALAQKKALEWELSLDSRDLRSHAWYHGPIPRQRAEEIVQREGDFLIRDCVSQPGNYVLTCRSKGPTLHFVINKVSIGTDKY